MPHDICVNGLSRSGLEPHRSVTFFYCLFFYESIYNTYLIKIPSWLQDIVTIVRSFI
jgi:hypothetical protein